MTKRINQCLSFLLALIMIASMIPASLFHVYADSPKNSNPTIWVEGYADGATSNFRASQTLEVKTSGFASNSKLTYSYYATSYDRGFFVVGGFWGIDIPVRLDQPEVPLVPLLEKTGNWFKDIAIALANVAIAATNAIITLANAVIELDNMLWIDEATDNGSNLFRVADTGSWGGSVKIVVKDVNPDSSTYNQTKEITVGNFQRADLSKDIGVPYSMFVGDSKTVPQLLEETGVGHINGCSLSHVTKFNLTDYTNNPVTYNGSVITAVQTGIAKVDLAVTKDKGCTYHPGQSGSGTSYIYVFKRPTITPQVGGFVITNTQNGVTYTVGGTSITCTEENQEIVFTDLAPDTTYDITLSATNPDGKIARKHVSGTTPRPYYGYLSYANLNGATTSPTLKVMNVNTKSEVPQTPTAYGHILTGWYDDAAFTVPHDFDTLIHSDFTLYGKWEALKSSLTLTLTYDEEALTDGTVELYQNDVSKYTLEETDDGIYYIADAVTNGTYRIFINGNDTKADINVETKITEKDITQEQYDARLSGDNLKLTVNMNQLTVVTRIDGVETKLDGVEFVYNGLHTTAFHKGNSSITYFVSTDNTVYDIFYNGVDTDVFGGTDSTKDVDKTNKVRYLDFYTVTVKAVTDDKDWVCDSMVLRTQNGKFVAKLASGEYDTTAGSRPYTMVMLKDEKNPATDLYIYVDGSNSARTVTATADGKNASIDFITVAITVNQDNAPKTDAELSFYDGANNQTVTANKNGVYAPHLIDNDKAYTVTVTGAKDTVTHTVDATNLTLTLNYFTQTFMSSETVNEQPVYNQFKYREYLVYDGEVIAAPTGAYLESVTFTCWNTEAYVPGEDSQQSYDFSAPVTAKHTFYAHFVGPKVEIGDFVKTDTDGKVSATGNSYTVPNLIITGYDEEKTLLSAKLAFTEISSAKIPVMSGCTVDTVSGTLPQTVGDYYVVTQDDTVVINLNEAVAPTELANWLKGIIVTPKESVENSVKITVSDGISSKYTEDDWDYFAEFDTDKYTKLTNLTAGQTLTTGFYYIEGDVVLDGTETGKNGLVIIGNVKLYIPDGSSLTAIGANGDGMTGGKAGILVPNGSDFTVFGDGKLTATGGNAGNGTDGANVCSDASNTTKQGVAAIQQSNGRYNIEIPDGGAGGNGGGGAGAGIGTNGGAGGAGAAKNPGFETIGATLYNGFKIGGTAGKSGSDGSNAADCGGFHCIGVTVTANGGASGTSGNGGTTSTVGRSYVTKYGGAATYSDKACCCINFDYNGFKNTCTTSGGGGGGGGGWNAPGVGTGGTGGGGGGAGAIGAFCSSSSSWDFYQATGGNGGSGAVAGTNGATANLGLSSDLKNYPTTAAAGGASVNAAKKLTTDDYTLNSIIITEYSNENGEAYTKLSNLTAGQTLSAGNYRIEGNITLDGTASGTNGLVIDGEVNLYIPAGSSLTAIGANGNGMTGGKAGILIPEDSGLTVFGDGTLTAKGGNAGNGANGTSTVGTTMTRTSDHDEYKSGVGGNGGNGGGGAGAGIGTDGGAGGNGGQVDEIQQNIYYNTFTHNMTVGGTAGQAGSDGSNAEKCGTFRSYRVMVTVNGGTSGTNGQGGTAFEHSEAKNISSTGTGSCVYYYPTISGYQYCVCATANGAGGGGGGGWNAPGVGTGGTGGGGGGAGGLGAYHLAQTSVAGYKNRVAAPGGIGGAGANGTGGNGASGEGGTEIITNTSALGGASVNAAKEIKSDEYTYVCETYRRITSLTTGQTLSTGNYYIDGNITLDGRATGTNGLVIDGKVKIYIPAGSSLTVYGANGDGMTGGKAGILLPSDSDLTVVGKGTLTATGGKAGDATNGEGGMGLYMAPFPDGVHYVSGYGGAGGNGGGGAGAGVGTDGGAGGAGGATIPSNRWVFHMDGKANDYSSAGQTVYGNPGADGEKASESGDFHCYGVSLDVKGGTSGANKAGGKAASGEVYYATDGSYTKAFCYYDISVNSKTFHIRASCSSAGGGGGGGSQARAIGTGGTGGGGGGSGTSGNCVISTSYLGYYIAYGGEGGAGPNGTTGGQGAHNGGWQRSKGPAAGGASDNTGTEITYAQYNLAEPKYTVSFDATAFGGVKTVKEYSYFTQTSVVVPSITTPAGLAFKGWTVTEGGSNMDDDKTPLCAGDTTLYQPEGIIVLDANTSGNITLKPVFELIKSKAGSGLLSIPDDVFVAEPTPITYYTYAVNTTINGTACSVGSITLKNGNTQFSLLPNADGSYAAVLTDNTSFDVYYNGKDTGVDVTSTGAATVAFSSIVINLKLDGTLNGTLGDIVLKGKQSVTVTPETSDNINTGVYKLLALSSDLEESYKVFIDNADIGITVAPADEKTVDFATVTVPLEGNTTPDSAYILDANGNLTVLGITDDELSAVVLASDKTYTLYVDGLNTGITVSPGGDNSVVINTVTATVSLNGTESDVVGFVPYYDGYAMENTEVGVYKTVVFGEVGNVTVNGKTFAPQNCKVDVNLYTVSYDIGTATGNCPIDSSIYFEGDDVTLSAEKSIFTVGKEFSGWTDGSSVYPAGGTLEKIGGKVTFVATFKDASEFDAVITVGSETHYIMTDDIPVILKTVSKDEGASITVLKSVTLTSCTLGKKDSLTVKTPAVVTVPVGETLTNNGTVVIEEGAKLIVAGDLENKNEITNDGTVVINENGQFVNGKNALFTNNGTFDYNGDKLDNKGTFDNNNILNINADGAENNGKLYHSGTVDSKANPAATLDNNGVIFGKDGTYDLPIDNYDGSVTDGTIANDGMIIGGTQDRVIGNTKGKEKEQEQKQAAAKVLEAKRLEVKNIVASYHLMEIGENGEYVVLDQNGKPITESSAADADLSYTQGTAKPLPKNLTRDGYVFEGWCKTLNFSDEPTVTISADDTGDLIFVAKWTKIEHYSDKTEEDVVAMTNPENKTTATYAVDGNAIDKVGGLVEEALNIKDASANKNKNVKLVLEANASDENTVTAGKTAIQEASTKGGIEFYDINVKQIISVTDEEPTETNLTEISTVLELVIPFDMTNKSDLSIMRYHNGEVEIFKEEDSHKDLTYTVEGTGENTKIHLFANRFCEYAIEYENIPPEVRDATYHVSLTLKESIDVNFKLKGQSADFDLSKLKVYVNDSTESIDLSMDAAGNVVGVLKSVAPAEMGDEITVKVKYNDIPSKIFTSSVRKYCEAVFKAYEKAGKNTANGKLYDLCVALLNYGACADNHFNGKSDSTINQDYVSDLSNVEIPEKEETGFFASEYVSKASASLELGEHITLVFKIKSSVQNLGPDTVMIINENNEKVSTANITVTPTDGDYNYIIKVHNLGASRLCHTYRLTITTVYQGFFKVKYGVYGYCYDAQNGTEAKGFTDSLKTLCKALYVYGEAAQTYYAALKK